MRLEDIQLDGLGVFTSEECGFQVDKYHLEEPWSYIYTTDKLLLRVDQHGLDYIQLLPPGGTILLKRERYQTVPSCFVWIKTGSQTAFSNFSRPTMGMLPYDEPVDFNCMYSPEKVVYRVCQDSILCETELFVSSDDPVVVMTCTITNTDSRSRELELYPIMRPHMASASLAPWDLPSLYQKTGYSNEEHSLFYLQLRSPAGIPEQRKHAFVFSDIDTPDAVEVSYASFIGRGSFECPEAVFSNKPLSISASDNYRYGQYSRENSVDGEQGVIRKLYKILERVLHSQWY